MRNLQVCAAIAIKKLGARLVSKLSTAKILLEVWDYRQDDLNFQEAKSILINELGYQQQIRERRLSKWGGDVFSNGVNRYMDAFKKKEQLLRDHAEAWYKLWSLNSPHYRPPEEEVNYIYRTNAVKTTVQDAGLKTKASYPYVRPQFALANGIIGQVQFDVEEDWDYYSKRCKRPKVTVTDKGVCFIYPRVKYSRCVNGSIDVEMVKTFQPTSTFAGNWVSTWMFKILAKEFGKQVVDRKLRRVQGYDCFSLRLERKLLGFEFYSRVVADTVYDVAIVCGKKIHYAATARQALAEFRAQYKAQKAHENEILSITDIDRDNNQCRVGGMVFCYDGVKQFCADNGIPLSASMSRADLRNLCLKDRRLNGGEKYASGLKELDIVIKPLYPTRVIRRKMAVKWQHGL